MTPTTSHSSSSMRTRLPTADGSPPNRRVFGGERAAARRRNSECLERPSRHDGAVQAFGLADATEIGRDDAVRAHGRERFRSRLPLRVERGRDLVRTPEAAKIGRPCRQALDDLDQPVRIGEGQRTQ
jgi:hypothetical protein